ncbi:MAG: hypothetical protein H6760_00480 [Candidatus Nomurabacteria bacterium]|nr:MAG: hypothetical protein H6760_00480 [Candidatus Nomurabacteria bacterium]
MTTLSKNEQGILATLAYFDVFDYPLREEEILRWFYVTSPSEHWEKSTVQETLRHSQALSEYIEQREGWYTLKHRGQLIERRVQRRRISMRKWRIARFATRLLRVIPFIRMVAVCNTLALNNAREESDIDFFIIARQGRMWTMRFLTTTLLDFARIRRKGAAIKDKICLSFYVTDAAMNLEPLRLQPVDPHFVYWADQFVLLYDTAAVFQDYQQANVWGKQYLPFAFSQSSQPQIRDTLLTSMMKQSAEWILGGRIGDWFEKFFRRIQLRKMDRNVHSRAWENDSQVIISDNILKFHEQDRREEYRRLFEGRLWEILRKPRPVVGEEHRPPLE